MLVGVPKEIKDHEYRVGLIPSTVRELVSKGHRVLVETGAGHGAGIGDFERERGNVGRLRSLLRFASQEIPNLTVLAAQALFKILSTRLTFTVRASDSNDGSYGFFLSLEESARWSSIESHFCDCVPQKFLNPGDFSSHRPPSP